MNSDVLKGRWKQLRGRIKKHWARLTADDISEIHGDRDILLGRIQELYGRNREEAEEELGDLPLMAPMCQSVASGGAG